MSHIDEKWRRAVGAARAALLLANDYNLPDLMGDLGYVHRPGPPLGKEMRAACEELCIASAYYVLAKVGEQFGEEFPDLDQMEAVAAEE